MNLDFSAGSNKSLDNLFNNLPRSLQRKAYTKALRAGARVVRDQIAENLEANTSGEFSTGFAKTQLRVYSYKKYRGNFRVGVQIKRGAVNTKKIVNGEPVRVGLYVGVLEYGKDNQPPRPSFRNGIKESKDKAVDALTKEMNKLMVESIQDAVK